MKSLVLLATTSYAWGESGDENGRKLIETTKDAMSNITYAIAESKGSDGNVQLEILQLAKEGSKLNSIAIFMAEATSIELDRSSIIDFTYLLESEAICIILAEGEIIHFFPLQGNREVVGAVDNGIKAAKWSPDQELLVLITGDDKVIAMTKDFEVLSEASLRTREFGEDAQVNVGWGQKSTQFHGSVGKSAAQQTSEAPQLSESISVQDDGRPRISWRGDSAFFAVSSLEPALHGGLASGSTGSTSSRTIRVFSRVAELSSTSEPVSGMEHALSWQPSGSIIATTQRQGDQLHVIFFERNGLRRYDFPLREEKGANSEVRELSWNADSTLLAVWLQRPQGEQVIKLWHRNNYHWYLKQEIKTNPEEGAHMTNFDWDPENPLTLSLTFTSGVEIFPLCWDTFRSCREPPYDDGAVAVLDGVNVRLTPFGHVNIPPPMFFTSLASSSTNHTPVHVAFSLLDNYIAALYIDGSFEVWDWALDKVGLGETGKRRTSVPAPKSVWAFEKREREARSYARQCVVCSSSQDGRQSVTVMTLTTSSGRDIITIHSKDSKQKQLQLPTNSLRIDRIIPQHGGNDGENTEFALSFEDGSIQVVSVDGEVLTHQMMHNLPEHCTWTQSLQHCHHAPRAYVGLTESGRLYVSSSIIAVDASSFTVSPDFLIYTTFSHEVCFLPLRSLAVVQGNSGDLHNDSNSAPEQKLASSVIKRAVERGSKIVTVNPSATTLVLQMPRGNLETISPRPLVLQVVRSHLLRGEFRSAFLVCRRHRIDLNIIYDYDPFYFKQNLKEFVTQIETVDYLNLFLSGLKNEDVTKTMYSSELPSEQKNVIDVKDKANIVCDLVRKDLEARDVFHYANTILTAYVRKQPPDYEGALRVLVNLKSKDLAQAEDAVKYIIFLSDANRLFDLALGMYDFQLVLLIAQHSQKDPREYLPFLRELRQLEPYLQRHKIDDYLQRYDSALKNLARAGSSYFEDALSYAKKHALFSTALASYRDDVPKYKAILRANAEYLMEQKHYGDAGLYFAMSGQVGQAIIAYQKANAWQEMFALAMSETRGSAAEIKALAIETSERLRSKRKFADAGRVLLEYGRDVEAAVAAFLEGSEFSEAIRLAYLYNRKDLIETLVKPATLALQSRLSEDIADVTDQTEKQMERLSELKEKRDSNPNRYYGVDEISSSMGNLELQPDGASDAGTAFTRYTTAAPSTMASGVSTSKTAKSRRRNQMKKLTGKKGSAFEETYLLNSFKKMVEVKFLEIESETSNVLRVLLSLNSNALRVAASTLQQELSTLETFVEKCIGEIWTWREEEWAAEKQNEEENRERGKQVVLKKKPEGMETVERPKKSNLRQKWRVDVLDAKVA